MKQNVSLLGVEFDAVTLDQAAQRCVDICRRSNNSHIVMTINASHLCMMRRDAELAHACSAADMTVADGMPVVWAIRASGQHMPERVAGIDLMEGLLRAAASNGLCVYFLGAHQDVVEKLVRVCEARFPQLKIAGFRNGYFGPDEHDVIVDEIRASGAHILFIGLPSPFKEVWSERYRERLQVPVILGVGGSFDVLAGFIKRAPRLFQSLGLEWFWRLMMEPRKLWRRYLSTNSEFIWLALREVVARRAYAVRRESALAGSANAVRRDNRIVVSERRMADRRILVRRRSNVRNPQAPIPDRRRGIERRVSERRARTANAPKGIEVSA
ncbi:N-acetylglucosaminyldiphosphoundecaprenol N-acetyl-beta-D-mannosaminyltransferase [Bradyrhizobium elkanii]|uniref:N-acetylglucosaminyldiphosphoundecaprenol N-acetyl-beta-D-mannosaminyltransferase n=1 Tax=Bradyrhizobium elkanii TaxID=29448 RepID=A0A8I1Y792_BRAEL|nr:MULTISPECIES: WecB/TagA/CpsF family glycosyltransferase [Bradyrhizobium]MBP1294557.1 N-acetylglucosaminyldiphosphoundecaprenol N-acetyl-beta-D-mannosaminyltransferase [Bradyrhizobium elkanii]MCP1925060.1 N-acetylglucosaminyldiphosphoundecaprenol N-acetyl-beta-D-mannosaminyltransferase [Bradyrhizobium elkanii]MCS3477451.1 N-acetylglucosaminyldiphosphoundecaprenol N-acetyl-beta-D-mannosaminyltransferase [Bradyrhizobium elkanii]MCS3584186.1 N-acetylglucosaminyldiphosphoundecaprenol N-acetyl-bet